MRKEKCSNWGKGCGTVEDRSADEAEGETMAGNETNELDLPKKWDVEDDQRSTPRRPFCGFVEGK
jgi:hypothetical protein